MTIDGFVDNDQVSGAVAEMLRNGREAFQNEGVRNHCRCVQ